MTKWNNSVQTGMQSASPIQNATSKTGWMLAADVVAEVSIQFQTVQLMVSRGEQNSPVNNGWQSNH
jgi:hypothetical protein